MTKYQLYYFDSRGRAEYARLVFAAAGVEYEDIRVSREEWPAMKKGENEAMLYMKTFSSRKLSTFCRRYAIRAASCSGS